MFARPSLPSVRGFAARSLDRPGGEGDGNYTLSYCRTTGMFMIILPTLYTVSIEKEICRLKWNWFFLILLAALDVVNYSSPLPSFHQFVTNPTVQQLNGTGREGKVHFSLTTNIHTCEHK